MKKIFGKIFITQEEYKEYMYLRSKDYTTESERLGWEKFYAEKYGFCKDEYERLKDENIELKFKLKQMLDLERIKGEIEWKQH